LALSFVGHIILSSLLTSFKVICNEHNNSFLASRRNKSSIHLTRNNSIFLTFWKYSFYILCFKNSFLFVCLMLTGVKLASLVLSLPTSAMSLSVLCCHSGRLQGLRRWPQGWLSSKVTVEFIYDNFFPGGPRGRGGGGHSCHQDGMAQESWLPLWVSARHGSLGNPCTPGRVHFLPYTQPLLSASLSLLGLCYWLWEEEVLMEGLHQTWVGIPVQPLLRVNLRVDLRSDP
jgi:hypothetical protein